MLSFRLTNIKGDTLEWREAGMYVKVRIDNFLEKDLADDWPKKIFGRDSSLLLGPEFLPQ
jgi:hypothetical protein